LSSQQGVSVVSEIADRPLHPQSDGHLPRLKGEARPGHGRLEFVSSVKAVQVSLPGKGDKTSPAEDNGSLGSIFVQRGLGPPEEAGASASEGLARERLRLDHRPQVHGPGQHQLTVPPHSRITPTFDAIRDFHVVLSIRATGPRLGYGQASQVEEMSTVGAGPSMLADGGGSTGEWHAHERLEGDYCRRAGCPRIPVAGASDVRNSFAVVTQPDREVMKIVFHLPIDLPRLRRKEANAAAEGTHRLDCRFVTFGPQPKPLSSRCILSTTGQACSL
jgi:hypothetical protein